MTAVAKNSCILVLNAGSSSVKFSLFVENSSERNNPLELFYRGQVEGLYQRPHFVVKENNGNILHDQTWEAAEHFDHGQAIDELTAWLQKNLSDYTLSAVGHRVVHGGEKYVHPVKITAEILEQLKAFIPLAPLHQPHNLAPIEKLLLSAPQLPQIACFDTAFHAGQDAVVRAYALPKAISDRGVKRYGFHGLSYEYIASVLPAYDAVAANGRTVVLHLGNGASMAALDAGKSIASTMGFTAMDGLPMGTRCGSIDPGVVLYLMQEMQMSADNIQHLLYSESGLLGVSGIASDMRTLMQSNEPSAQFAIELFVYRIVRELGSLVAALGGLDAIVFTGGIGENAALVREKVCAKLAWLNVVLNDEENAENHLKISSAESKVGVWVIPTNEELMIAQHARDLLGK
jgi:acetate kinase